MKLHIIHLPHRADRLDLLSHQLRTQHIFDYKICEGILNSAAPHKGIAQAHKIIVRKAQVDKLDRAV